MPRQHELTECIPRGNERFVVLVERFEGINFFRTTNQRIAAEVSSMSAEIKDDRIIARYSERFPDKYLCKCLIIDVPAPRTEEHAAESKIKRHVAPAWRGQSGASQSVLVKTSLDGESNRDGGKPAAGSEREFRLQNAPDSLGMAQLQAYLPLRTRP